MKFDLVCYIFHLLFFFIISSSICLEIQFHHLFVCFISKPQVLSLSKLVDDFRDFTKPPSKTLYTLHCRIMGSPSSLEALWTLWKPTPAYFFANRSSQRRKSRFSSPETLWMRWKYGHRTFFPWGLIPTPGSVVNSRIHSGCQGERSIDTRFPGDFQRPRISSQFQKI